MRLTRFTVYALVDPITRQARYIGVSRKGARQRAAAHWCEARMYESGGGHPFGPPVQQWLQELARARRAPVVRVLATCSLHAVSKATPPFASALERSWMNFMARRNPLLNAGFARITQPRRTIKVSATTCARLDELSHRLGLPRNDVIERLLDSTVLAREGDGTYTSS